MNKVYNIKDLDFWVTNVHKGVQHYFMMKLKGYHQPPMIMVTVFPEY